MADVEYINIDGTIRSVERVDDDTILIVTQRDGRMRQDAFHKELQLNVRLSDAAFDDLEQKLRRLIRL